MSSTVIIQPWGGHLPESATYRTGTEIAEMTLRKGRRVNDGVESFLCGAPMFSFRVPDEDAPEVRTAIEERTTVIEDKSRGTITTRTEQHVVTVSTQKSSKGFKKSELIGQTYVGDLTTPSIWRSEPIAREMDTIKLETTGINNGGLGVVLGINPPFPKQQENSEVVVDSYGWFPLDPSQAPGTHYHEQGTMLSLRKTCRLVYEEATELVYGHTFVFRSHHDLSGFLSQLTPALRNSPRKIFRKGVLHIGQDKRRITSTFNLLTEDDKAHETRGVWHHFPNPRMEPLYALAQGWTKAIRTRLNRHQVQELVLVAGSGNRALLTDMYPHKPLMRNLLANTFRVDTLTILDINPAKILSEYKLPKKLKAIWENTKSSEKRYNPNWEEEVMSADEEDAEASDGEGIESTNEEGTESTDEEETESAGEEDTTLDSPIGTDNGSDGYSGSHRDVNQHQSAALMDIAQSSKDPESLQSTISLTATAKITHNKEFTETPIDPILPCLSSVLLPHALDYNHT